MRASEEAITATSTPWAPWSEQAQVANAEARRKLAAEPEDDTG